MVYDSNFPEPSLHNWYWYWQRGPQRDVVYLYLGWPAAPSYMSDRLERKRQMRGMRVVIGSVLVQLCGWRTIKLWWSNFVPVYLIYVYWLLGYQYSLPGEKGLALEYLNPILHMTGWFSNSSYHSSELQVIDWYSCMNTNYHDDRWMIGIQKYHPFQNHGWMVGSGIPPWLNGW